MSSKMSHNQPISTKIYQDHQKSTNINQNQPIFKPGWSNCLGEKRREKICRVLKLQQSSKKLFFSAIIFLHLSSASICHFLVHCSGLTCIFSSSFFLKGPKGWRYASFYRLLMQQLCQRVMLTCCITFVPFRYPDVMLCS